MHDEICVARAAEVDAVLPLADGGGWLHGCPPDDGHAGGDSAQDAARIVLLTHDALVLDAVGVVVLRAEKCGGAESRAKLHTLDGWDTVGDSGNAVLEPVEHRVADACGHAIGNALDDASHGVQLGLGHENGLVHGAGGASADAGQLVCSDGLNLGGVEGHVIEVLVADALGTELGDVGYDANPQRLLECLQGDAAGNAQRRREAAREVAAAGDVMVVAIANIGGVVGMSGSGHAAKPLVVLAARVRVLDDGRQRRAARVAVDEAGEDARSVGLATGRRRVGAPRCPAGEKGLKLVKVYRDARRQSLDDTADRLGVGLAEDGEAHGVPDVRCHGYLTVPSTMPPSLA